VEFGETGQSVIPTFSGIEDNALCGVADCNCFFRLGVQPVEPKPRENKLIFVLRITTNIQVPIIILSAFRETVDLKAKTDNTGRCLPAPVTCFVDIIFSHPKHKLYKLFKYKERKPEGGLLLLAPS